MLSSVTVFTSIIISVLVGFEDLFAQRQALGNHRATGAPFAVTTRQLLGGYGFCMVPLFGTWNERCLDVRPQEKGFRTESISSARGQRAGEEHSAFAGPCCQIGQNLWFLGEEGEGLLRQLGLTGGIESTRKDDLHIRLQKLSSHRLVKLKALRSGVNI